MGIPVKTLIFAIANLALVVALAWRIVGVEYGATGAAPARAQIVVPASALDKAAASADLASLSTQPVFHKTRQFVVPPDPAAPDLRPPPPSYLFAGAMLLPGRPPVAYLKHAQTRQSLKVRVGEVVEGWTVNAIDARSVALEFSGEIITIGHSAKQAGGIVAVAPRAAAATPSTGVRVLTAPSGPGAATPTSAPRAESDQKPRTYQPPPSS